MPMAVKKGLYSLCNKPHWQLTLIYGNFPPPRGSPAGFGGLHHYEAVVLLSCCLLVTIKILTKATNILFHS